MLGSAAGLAQWLWLSHVLLKDFARFAQTLSDRLREASLAVAQAAGRPALYLQNPGTDKLALAQQIAARERIQEGLVCVLSAVEPCWSYRVVHDPQASRLSLRKAYRKCLHVYHYFIDPALGWMHGRLQTWLPADIQVYVNGREWLSRQMDQAGLSYRRWDNSFLALWDVAAAQALSDAQLRTDWPALLDGVARRISPGHAQVFADAPFRYYWTVEQSEYASDVMFQSRAALAALYPRLLHQGLKVFDSPQVLRFLGQALPRHGQVHGSFAGQVLSDLRRRPEGLRLKHWMDQNSIKLYDKASVLRVETTLNHPQVFKVYRTKSGDDAGAQAWRSMRKGVADLHRRAQVCRAANARYLEALAALPTGKRLGDLAAPLCRRRTWKGRPVRPLNPLADADHRLLAAVARGEFTLRGLRNRDLRVLLYGPDPRDPLLKRRRSAAVTRQLRLLRAHALIRKIPKSHSYQVTAAGRRALTTLLTARQADAEKLLDLAA
jgi:hypothetical protein